MSMIGNDEALDYITCGIPDMLGELDEETVEYYQRFVNRIKYLVNQNTGKKPKFHKGMRVGNDYWTCGSCGTTVRRDVGSKYCDRCGYAILWDSPRCLTGYNGG